MRTLMLAALAAAAIAQRPNVLFLLVDDLGSSDVSFHHKIHRPDVPPSIETPAIDFLADSGIKLKQYYTHHACSPTRSAFLTGRYHVNVGNPFPALGGGGWLPREYKTIAQELSNRGYRNYIVGKWGVEGYGDGNVSAQMPPGSGIGPTERGFDEFYGIVSHAHDHYTKLSNFEPFGSIDMNRFYKGGPHYSYPDVDPEPELHSTRLWTREATSVLRRHIQEHAGSPFFLQLAYTAPHDPLQADAEWVAHPSCRDIQNWRRRVYCGMVIGVDQSIANLTQSMQDMGVDLDNTIIIFSSDNGGAPIVGGFNTPFRGAKAGSWEGSCRVPGFIRAPRLLGSQGRVFPGLVHVVDWAPTILSLVDGEPGNHSLLDQPHEQGPIDGMDVSTSLRDSSASPRKEALLVSEMWVNRTSFVMQAPAEGGGETTWKVVMGYTGESRRSSPPTGRWTYNDRDFLDQVSEVYRDAILLNFGEEYYVLEWAWYFLIEMIRSALYGLADESLSVVFGSGSPMWRLENNRDTVPMADALPLPEWDRVGNGLWLFDLDADPYETNDLSEEHPELVERMGERVIEIIENAAPQMGAVQYAFQQAILGQIAIISVVVVLVCCCGGCCCCYCGRLVRESMSPSEKKEDGATSQVLELGQALSKELGQEGHA